MRQKRRYKKIDPHLRSVFREKSFKTPHGGDPDIRAEKPWEVRHLPYKVRLIAEIIGSKATLTLAKQCKHRCVYIPKQWLPDDHFLICTIGRELTERLQSHFEGELIYFPRCTQTDRLERDKAIREALDAGKTREEIAAEYKLSKRHVENILKPELAERNRQRQRARRKYERLTRTRSERTKTERTGERNLSKVGLYD